MGTFICSVCAWGVCACVVVVDFLANSLSSVLTSSSTLRCTQQQPQRPTAVVESDKLRSIAHIVRRFAAHIQTAPIRTVDREKWGQLMRGYIWMYAHTYTCTYMHTYIYIHVYIYVHTHYACAYIYKIYIKGYIQTWLYIQVHKYKCLHYLYVYTCIIYMHTYTYEYVYLYIYIYIYIHLENLIEWF